MVSIRQLITALCTDDYSTSYSLKHTFICKYNCNFINILQANQMETGILTTDHTIQNDKVVNGSLLFGWFILLQIHINIKTKLCIKKSVCTT